MTDDLVCVSQDADESFDENMSVEDNTMHAAYMKAKQAEGWLKEGRELVVAADTVVVLDGNVLGKPRSREEAEDMLLSLSGRTHSVITGVCVLSEERSVTFADTTLVTFRSLTPEMIKAYIDSGEPMDKAGAYGIQGRGRLFVEKIEGNYENVVGLPLTRLTEVIETCF